MEQDYTGLTPKLEQIIRAFEFTQLELAVYRDRGYAQGRGVAQPEEGRCALGDKNFNHMSPSIVPWKRPQSG